MAYDSGTVDFRRFPEKSRVEGCQLHDFICSVLIGARSTLIEEGVAIRLEYRRAKGAAIVCRVLPTREGAVLEIAGRLRRAPQFSASTLVGGREREMAEFLLRLVGGASSRTRRRAAGAAAPSQPQAASLPDDRDVECPICATRVWLWKLEEHAAVAHGVRLVGPKGAGSALCIICLAHLRLEAIDSHVCPERSRSVYTVSGGLPGGGKRR
jgi:hypothetical protein